MKEGLWLSFIHVDTNIRNDSTNAEENTTGGRPSFRITMMEGEVYDRARHDYRSRSMQINT